MLRITLIILLGLSACFESKDDRPSEESTPAEVKAPERAPAEQDAAKQSEKGLVQHTEAEVAQAQREMAALTLADVYEQPSASLATDVGPVVSPVPTAPNTGANNSTTTTTNPPIFQYCPSPRPTLATQSASLLASVKGGFSLIFSSGSFTGVSSSAMSPEDAVGALNGMAKEGCTWRAKVYRCAKNKIPGVVDHSFVGIEFTITCPNKPVQTINGIFGLPDDPVFGKSDAQFFDTNPKPAECTLLGETSNPDVIQKAADVTTDWANYMSNGGFVLIRQILGTPILGKPCSRATEDVVGAILPNLDQTPFVKLNCDGWKSKSGRAAKWFLECCTTCARQDAKGFDAYYNPIIPNRCTCK